MESTAIHTTDTKRVLLLSPLSPGSGNAATASRLADGLRQSSQITVNCVSVDTPLIDFDSLLSSIRQHDAILALHAYRAGHLLTSIYQNHSDLPPLIIIFAGTDLHSCEPEWLPTIKQIVQIACGLVCFSLEWKEHVEICYKDVLACPITVIPQSVLLLPPIAERLPLSKPLPSARKTIIWAGGLRAVKDPIFAIHVMSHLTDHEFQLIIVGGEANCSLLDAIQSSCSQRNVTLIGSQPTDHVHTLMRTGFAYLNTSVNEGMCLAILEAMALGLPVVARRNTGNISIVRDGETGLLYDTPEQAAECLLQLEKESPLRETLIKQAADQVNKVHNPILEITAYQNLILGLTE
jgi:glycosyltransferase involved in cell wall biosynthesis